MAVSHREKVGPQGELLADDLLYGAAAIAEFMFGDRGSAGNLRAGRKRSAARVSPGHDPLRAQVHDRARHRNARGRRRDISRIRANDWSCLGAPASAEAVFVSAETRNSLPS